MNFSKFFIERPIFAAVLSLMIVAAGAIALFRLPISEYPQVVPPTVVVHATYPGANPKVIAETVASPLEQQLNGIEDMLYMFSQATSDGRMTLTITFALGTDLDNAQVQVQNRVAQALPRLPAEVQRIGVVTEKSTPDFIMVVHLVSPDERYDNLYLANYAYLRVKDELARIPGVGSAQGVRRGRVQHADLARSGSTRVATADDDGRHQGDSRAERASGGGCARRAAGAGRHAVPALGQRARAPDDGRTSSRTSWCARRRKGRSRACAMWGVSSSARISTRCAVCWTTSQRSRSASSSGLARTRSTPPIKCATRWSG
jgi:hypothetical protein